MHKVMAPSVKWRKRAEQLARRGSFIITDSEESVINLTCMFLYYMNVKKLYYPE